MQRCFNKCFEKYNSFGWIKISFNQGQQIKEKITNIEVAKKTFNAAAWPEKKVINLIVLTMILWSL